MSVVHSVNIMVAILLVAVSVVVYYLIRYDYYFPNDLTDSHDDNSSHGKGESSTENPDPS